MYFTYMKCKSDHAFKAQNKLNANHTINIFLKTSGGSTVETLATIAKAEKDSNYGTDWGDYTVMEKPSWL